MMTNRSLVPGSQSSRRIPLWDIMVTGVCLVLTFATAVLLAMATGGFVMAGDSCAPDSPCLDEVGRGMDVSLLGMLTVLLIGLGCVITATLTRRTRLFVWALATLVLLPFPFAVGAGIANDAMKLSTVAPSGP